MVPRCRLDFPRGGTQPLIPTLVPLPNARKWCCESSVSVASLPKDLDLVTHIDLWQQGAAFNGRVCIHMTRPQTRVINNCHVSCKRERPDEQSEWVGFDSS